MIKLLSYLVSKIDTFSFYFPIPITGRFRTLRLVAVFRLHCLSREVLSFNFLLDHFLWGILSFMCFIFFRHETSRIHQNLHFLVTDLGLEGFCNRRVSRPGYFRP